MVSVFLSFFRSFPWSLFFWWTDELTDNLNIFYCILRWTYKTTAHQDLPDFFFFFKWCFLLNRHGQEGTLLESQVGPASLLQGVFMLQKNDAVVVQASDGQLHTARSRSTFFGLYLIRTWTRRLMPSQARRSYQGNTQFVESHGTLNNRSLQTSLFP